MKQHLGPRKRHLGFTLIELLVVMAIIGTLVGLILPAVQAARESARRMTCKNNLRQLALALQLYHDAHQTFPSGYIRGTVRTPRSSFLASIKRVDAPPPHLLIPPSKPGWGWAALMLPYVEQGSLHGRIDFGVSVEEPANADVRSFRLKLLVCPTDIETGVYIVYDDNNVELVEAATNSYAASFGARGLINTDPDNGSGLFQRNSRHRIPDIKDGTSNTLAIGERGCLLAQSAWAGVITGGTVRTTPGAPVYSAVVEKAPAIVLARIGNRTLNSPYSEPYDFFSPHRHVVHFALADGSVRALNVSLELKVLRALATRDSGDDTASAFE